MLIALRQPASPCSNPIHYCALHKSLTCVTLYHMQSSSMSLDGWFHPSSYNHTPSCRQQYFSDNICNESPLTGLSDMNRYVCVHSFNWWTSCYIVHLICQHHSQRSWAWRYFLRQTKMLSFFFILKVSFSLLLSKLNWPLRSVRAQLKYAQM